MTVKVDNVGITKRKADIRYVNVPGDTMTGALTITPASGDTALTANKDIVLKAGQKMIYDGA